jgi:hypothetical protein
MNYLEEVVGQINEQMAALIYQIGQQQPHLDLHRQAVEVMLQLSELERIARSGGQRRRRKGRAEWMSEAQLQEQEVRKVSRKLLRWSDHLGQVNSRLLIHYLELRRQGVDPVTRSSIEQFAEQEGIKNFNSNFFGMSHIGEKNHGKVFDLVDGVVTLWPPVMDVVAQFEGRVTALAAEQLEPQPSAPQPPQPRHHAAPASAQQSAAERAAERTAERSPVVERSPAVEERASADERAPYELIYRQFKALWLKRIERAAALDELQRSGVQRAVGDTHLQVLESMMRGEPYQSVISAEATRYFIDSIRTDFSRGYLERALRAAEPHLGQ